MEQLADDGQELVEVVVIEDEGGAVAFEVLRVEALVAAGDRQGDEEAKADSGSSPITDAPERERARSAAAIAHGISSCM
jgi:hypothetical protein